MKNTRLAAIVSFLTLSYVGVASAQDAVPVMEAPPPDGYVAPPPGYVAPPPAQVAVVAVPAPPADSITARNSIYVELLGPGLLYSVNFERLVTDDLALRIGVGAWKFSASASSGGSSISASATYISLPITISYVGLRAGSSSLELGAGGTLIYATGTASGLGFDSEGSGATVLGTAMVGYRLQPRDGGFQFRVGLGLLAGKGLGKEGDFGATGWGYLSAGYSF